MNEDCIKPRGARCIGATSTFNVVPDPELDSALRQWAGRIAAAHPGVREVRCYKRPEPDLDNLRLCHPRWRHGMHGLILGREQARA